jgi:hypothetical protein
MTILQIVLTLLLLLMDLRVRRRAALRQTCALVDAQPVPMQWPLALSRQFVACGRNSSGLQRQKG